MTKRHGITLVEVMVTALLTALIVGSIATAFAITVRYQTEFGRARADFESKTEFEDRLKSLLEHCYYSTTDPDKTYFKGDSTQGDSSTSDRLTFTMAGNKLAGPVTASTTEEFSDRNETFGPVGGVTEVGVSTVPVGDAGSRQGVFLRKQTPADGDLTQGGYESVLDENIDTVLFEFYDGTAWIATWDTQLDSKLPPAVRVTYTRKDDAETEYAFVVRIPQANLAPEQQGVQQP